MESWDILNTLMAFHTKTPLDQIQTNRGEKFVQIRLTFCLHGIIYFVFSQSGPKCEPRGYVYLVDPAQRVEADRLIGGGLDTTLVPAEFFVDYRRYSLDEHQTRMAQYVKAYTDRMKAMNDGQRRIFFGNVASFSSGNSIFTLTGGSTGMQQQGRRLR